MNRYLSSVEENTNVKFLFSSNNCIKLWENVYERLIIEVIPYDKNLKFRNVEQHNKNNNLDINIHCTYKEEKTLSIATSSGYENALINATYKKYFDIVVYLIEHGTDFIMKDDINMTRVNDYAIMSRNIELMKYLKRFEAGQH
ncbi:hypothetical protein H8356DRAFT_1327330 [Neocallimastix lanati (nom. inval.)]|nr:hypothetical protein H8356DRAFT_1327330 [Neocallimastix sp. JGI-2020a]